MDATHCNVIYVDNSIREDRIFRARDVSQRSSLNVQAVDASLSLTRWESKTLEENVSLLSDVFGDVHLCGTGAACLEKLFNMQDELIMDLKPTVVLISTPHDEEIPIHEQSRPSSPLSVKDPESVPNTPPAGDVYGLRLLQRIVSEAHLRNLSKLIVPVSVITFPDVEETANSLASSLAPLNLTGPKFSKSGRAQNRPLMKGCLKLGATDVFFSPIQPQSITSLEIRAYWAHKSAARDQQALKELQRGRKRSWVGIADNRPYAYLRETMVASLMRKICQMEEGDELPVDAVRIHVSSQRKPVVAEAVGNWHFSAHAFDDDELVEASALMFKHALSMPELENWRIPLDQLICFLVACRSAYNSFVPYHNFRHVVDVLQATFSFLLNIGALPPYPLSPAGKTAGAAQQAPMASLIRPFEALTLLITAIGHDVGHPGVNNGFLIVLNAPLAQLYNDRSVLESFHCAAYSQILRRYWPATFNDTNMRKLMISSILATDMGLHFDYMNKLGSTQDKLSENNTTDGWNGRTLEDQTALACALLIKCADISNVARHQDAAIQWMHILSDEFSRQAYMENQLAIKSSLVSQPRKDTISLYQSQLGFMNLFAIPLFQGVASIMPGMQYCVDELETNKRFFEHGIEQAKAAMENESPDGALSPRSQSMAVPNDDGRSSKKDVPGTTEAAEQIKESPLASAAAADPGPVAKLLANNVTSAVSEETASAKQIPSNIRVLSEKDAFTSHFDAVAEFAASDPFHSKGQQSFRGHGQEQSQDYDDDDDASRRFAASSKQRVSEATAATEVTDGGSTSLPSATTGKMPLSPSTQGTSIVSRDSDSYGRPGSSGHAAYNGVSASASAGAGDLDFASVFASGAGPGPASVLQPPLPRTPYSTNSAHSGHSQYANSPPLYPHDTNGVSHGAGSNGVNGHSNVYSNGHGHGNSNGNSNGNGHYNNSYNNSYNSNSALSMQMSGDMDGSSLSSSAGGYSYDTSGARASGGKHGDDRLAGSPPQNGQGQPTLKKKSSRFRMNAMTFLRRHLNPGQAPPIPTSNPTDPHAHNHPTSS